eukprot:403011-Amphidinium_carterae.1
MNMAQEFQVRFSTHASSRGAELLAVSTSFQSKSLKSSPGAGEVSSLRCGQQEKVQTQTEG